jgi:hypothetical protein
MNTKQILFASCVAAMTLSASIAIAGSHGGSAGGGFSGGGARAGGGGSPGGFAGSRMTPGFARSGSRFGPGFSGNFRGDRFRHGRFNNFVFFDDFGDPFFYPYYYGYYPYGYPYGYGPYGYGYDPYDQPGYPGVAAGTGSVRGLQLRLARAGYYHGRIDGVMGSRTRYALRAYERSRNSRVTAQ